jgi:hypothetical protein
MTYLGGPYYPWWLDNLADDVTGDGAAFQSPAQGAEAVRAIVLAARELYKHQEFSFIGDYDDRFLEEYTCQILGEPTSAVVIVTRNAAEKAQQIVVNHRPRSSVLLFARAMGEKFAGTPLAEIFIALKWARPRRLQRRAARLKRPHRLPTARNAPANAMERLSARPVGHQRAQRRGGPRRR